MRICRAILTGLLTIQSGTSFAGAVNADLRVSAAVPSICAVSSLPSIPRGPFLIARRGVARVGCSPSTAFTIASDTRRTASVWMAETDAASAFAPALSRFQPAERVGDTLVVEIAY